VPDYGWNDIGAEVMISGKALPAVHVALGVPADSNSLSDLKSLYRVPKSHNLSNYFVTWDQRILR
jgi:hypothetical protein